MSQAWGLRAYQNSFYNDTVNSAEETAFEVIALRPVMPKLVSLYKVDY
jgi:hypothetical protein